MLRTLYKKVMFIIYLQMIVKKGIHYKKIIIVKITDQIQINQLKMGK